MEIGFRKFLYSVERNDPKFKIHFIKRHGVEAYESYMRKVYEKLLEDESKIIYGDNEKGIPKGLLGRK